MNTVKATQLNPTAVPTPPPIKISGNMALVGLLLGIVCISFAPIFVRLSEIGPNPLAFWRIALTLPFFWTGVAVQNKFGNTPKLPKTGRNIGLLAGCGAIFAIAVVAGHWSIHHTSVANAMLFANMVPIYVALVSWLFLGQRFNRSFIVGLLLAFIGAIFLVAKNVRIDSNTMLGDGLALLVAVSYGTYLMLMEKLRQHFSTTSIMAWSTIVTAILLVPLALGNNGLIVPTTMRGWFIVLGIAIVTQALGRSLVVFALSSLPATYSSVTLLLQPVLASLWALFLLSEPITSWQLVGGSIVVCGIILVQIERRRSTKHA